MAETIRFDVWDMIDGSAPPSMREYARSKKEKEKEKDGERGGSVNSPRRRLCAQVPLLLLVVVVWWWCRRCCGSGAGAVAATATATATKKKEKKKKKNITIDNCRHSYSNDDNQRKKK